jgi:hypothetical protein
MVKQSPIDLLRHLIQVLPNLISCKFFSISLKAKKDLPNVKFLNVYLTNSQNQITKICIEELHKIEEFYSICTICPFTKFFQVERVYDMTIELFLSSLLNYINTNHCYIRVLCLNVPAADDDTLKCFKEIIEQKHLVIDFTIKRILNRIYLQWN